jgi:hypothetical protein
VNGESSGITRRPSSRTAAAASGTRLVQSRHGCRRPGAGSTSRRCRDPGESAEREVRVLPRMRRPLRGEDEGMPPLFAARRDPVRAAVAPRADLRRHRARGRRGTARVAEAPTNHALSLISAGVAELVDAAGLGPVGSQGPWRFESSRPHRPAGRPGLPAGEAGLRPRLTPLDGGMLRPSRVDASIG